MTTLGLCTQFTETDKWAFDFALHLVQERGWQLSICHWLKSPYQVRRDMVQDDLFNPQETRPITPQLLAKLELQLREYYEAQLGDFTNVGFKLCEGQYQVEMARCFRNHLLDLVVMGYRAEVDDSDSGGLPVEEFAAHLHHPLVLIGRDGPGTFLLNAQAVEWVERLGLPEGSWQVIEGQPA